MSLCECSSDISNSKGLNRDIELKNIQEYKIKKDELVSEGLTPSGISCDSVTLTKIPTKPETDSSDLVCIPASEGNIVSSWSYVSFIIPSDQSLKIDLNICTSFYMFHRNGYGPQPEEGISYRAYFFYDLYTFLSTAFPKYEKNMKIKGLIFSAVSSVQLRDPKFNKNLIMSSNVCKDPVMGIRIFNVRAMYKCKILTDPANITAPMLVVFSSKITLILMKPSI